MYPSIQSARSHITSTATQLMTLVGPAPLMISDVVMRVNRIVFATISHCTNNTSVIKFHISTAIRTAVSTRVAEVLRNVGAKLASDILSVESSPT